MTHTEEDIGNRIRSALAALPLAEADASRLVRGQPPRHRMQANLRVASLLAVAAAVLVAAVVLATRSPAVGRQAGTPGPRSGFPVLKRGMSCPTSLGHPVSNAYFGGVALGRGPVRMLIVNEGHLRHGVVFVSPANKGNSLGPRNYYVFQNFWYSLPWYRPRFTVEAKRLDGQGRVLFGNSFPTQVAQAVPAGPDQAFGRGFRSGIGSTWVTTPGCYGFRVIGHGIHELVVVDVVLHKGRGPHRS